METKTKTKNKKQKLYAVLVDTGGSARGWAPGVIFLLCCIVGLFH